MKLKIDFGENKTTFSVGYTENIRMVTEADKAEMVAAYIAALPDGDEVSY